MVTRHFVFFDQTDGSYIREWRGPVQTPTLPPGLSSEVRKSMLNLWATAVSEPEANEIGLDVTQFNWPVGDFQWSCFDLVDQALLVEEPHHFIQLERATACIDAGVTSARPVRDSETKAILEITGTPLEAIRHSLFGQVRRQDGQALLLRQAGEPIPLDLGHMIEHERIPLLETT